MIKKEILLELSRKVPKIPIPENYFSVTGNVPSISVSNILLFSRDSCKILPSRHDTSHSRFLLTTSLFGEGEAVIDGVRFALQEKHAILIFPHQHHHFYYLPEKLNWLMVTFKAKNIEMLLKLKNLAVEINEPYCIFMSLLCDEFMVKDGHKTDPLKCENLLALLLNELCHQSRLSNQSPPLLVPDFIDEVNAYLYHQSEQHNITTGEIAAHLHLSTSHFRFVFKQKMGISFGKYYKQICLSKAKSLLGNTNLTISEIAGNCNYSSVYAFSNAFKKFTGITPGQYRKGQKALNNE